MRLWTTEESCDVREDLLDARRPESVQRDHKLIRLVIEDCHSRIHHSDVRAVLAELWAMYWASKATLVLSESGQLCCLWKDNRKTSQCTTNHCISRVQSLGGTILLRCRCGSCRTSVHQRYSGMYGSLCSFVFVLCNYSSTSRTS